MSSMPTPRDTALPEKAVGGSLRSRTVWQSIGYEACLIEFGVASRKRQRVPIGAWPWIGSSFSVLG